MCRYFLWRCIAVVGRGPPPVLEPGEHDLDPVPAFVATLVTLNRCLPLLPPPRDAGACTQF